MCPNKFKIFKNLFIITIKQNAFTDIQDIAKAHKTKHNN